MSYTANKSPMRTIFVLVGAAILVFLAFTAFSVQKSIQGSARLAQIKDLYFPVLQRVDANIVRVDKLEELFIQVVVLGDRDSLDTARELSGTADAAFAEMATLYPERGSELAQLRGELTHYHDLAQSVSQLYLEEKPAEAEAAEMNKGLEVLREHLQAFRESSYANFVETLEATQKTTRLSLLLGIALGVMNLCFMGVLVYFIRNNIRMMAVIAEQNATLEQRVAERTAQLTQKTNDINAMLQNMSLGVCTIVPGNTIHPEYSAQLPEIFGIDGDVAGRDVIECLFERSTLGADVRDQVTVSIGAIVGESAMMFEFNGHLLPREMQIAARDGAVRVIQMEWSPIVGSGDTVEKLLFIAQDVTDLRALELASAQQKAELELISRLLALPVGKFNDFTASATTFIAANRELIAAVDHAEPMTIAALFRNMHTIKGNARTLGLTLVTDVANAAEQAYDRLRKDPNEPWNAARLSAELDEVEAAVARYVDVNDNKLGRNGRSQDLFTGRGAFVANEELDRLKQLATVIGRSRQDTGVVELCQGVARLGLVPLERIVSGCVDSVASLARELGKPEPHVALTGGDIAFTPPFAEALKSSLMHMVRNALDHGIEMPDERVRSGKPERGELRIHCERRDGTVELRVGDDGRGLALKALLRRGRQAGVFGEDETPAPQVVAELIFRSGLSTAQAVTQMSGRGVGMDAVRTFLGEQGATAGIELTAPANEQEFAPFRFVIQVPAAAAGA